MWKICATLKEFYQKISPGHYKTEDNFIQKCTLWMLGKLDEHIIERNLNYNLYKKEIIKQVKFIPDVVHEDNYFCVKAYSLAKKICISNICIYSFISLTKKL